MGDDQPRLYNHRVAKQDQIEIERARRVVVRTLAAAFALDRQKAVEQLTRGERGLPHGRRVQIDRLRARHADGHRVVVARGLQVVEESRESRDGEVEVSGTVPEVASKCDRGNHQLNDPTQ